MGRRSRSATISGASKIKALISQGFFISIFRRVMDRSEARRKYAAHKSNAAQRGIEWQFTFEEWCEIWEPHWERRGSHKEQLGMCRTRDQGGYRAGNVRLDTPRGNAGDRVLMRRRPWMADDVKATTKSGFKSYGSKFPYPDRALEIEQEEYEWIPGE